MNKDIDVVKKYNAVMNGAKSRNLDFDVSFSEFKKVYNTKKCYYTGKKLIHGYNFSIDRVDNSKGYISGNIVACDKDFNTLKSNLTIEQITAIFNGIQKFYLKDGRNKKKN